MSRIVGGIGAFAFCPLHQKFIIHQVTHHGVSSTCCLCSTCAAFAGGMQVCYACMPSNTFWLGTILTYYIAITFCYGPNTEPCGTPEAASAWLLYPSTTTRCFLSGRESVNHDDNNNQFHVLLVYAIDLLFQMLWKSPGTLRHI